MTTIQKTTDYDRFSFSPENRDIDPYLVKLLISSIQQHNLLKYRPIDVSEDMEVIDGQHRLMAARSLGIEIYYRVVEATVSDTVILLNNASKGWVPEDYVKHYAAKGIRDYIELKKVMDEWGVSAAFVLSFMGLSSHQKILRSGNLKFSRDRVLDVYDYYTKVSDLVCRYRPVKERGFLKGRTFCRALTCFIKTPEVDSELFLSKLELKMNYLRLCTNVYDYLICFQEIYNHRNRKPIDLAFNRYNKLEEDF